METLLVGTSYCYCGHPAAAEKGGAACLFYKMSASFWRRSSERLTFGDRKQCTSREHNGHQSQILFGTLQLLGHNLQDLLGCTRNFCLHTDVGVLRHIHVAKNCRSQTTNKQVIFREWRPRGTDSNQAVVYLAVVLGVRCEQLGDLGMST